MENKKLLIIIGTVIGLFVIIGLVLFIVLKQNKITITFVNDDMVSSTIKVKKGEKVTFPVTREDGYTFEGWYYEGVKLHDGVSFDHDVVIIAKWIANGTETMTITFDTNGGNILGPITIECDSKLNLPTPTKQGYNFINWQDINEIIISNETKLVCEDITLKAKWEKVREQKEELIQPSSSNVKKEYTCPDGYALNDTECTLTKDATMVCPKGTYPDNTYEYKDKCVKLVLSYRQNSIKECGTYTVVVDDNGHTQEIKGTVAFYRYDTASGISGYYYCAYGLVDNRDEQNNQSVCTSRGHKWVEGRCFYDTTGPGVNINYKCANPSYVYLTNDEANNIIPNSNLNGCFPIVAKQATCESDFTLNNNKCTKTIDAIEK